MVIEDDEVGWKSFEFVEVDEVGAFSDDPVTGALRLHSAQADRAIAKMQRLEDRGWPDAEASMYVPGRTRKKAIVQPDRQKYPEVWLLKCTPHAWRLYFYIWENGDDKRIIYLHALYKKRIGDEEVATAAKRHQRLCAGDHCKTAEINFD